MINQRELRIGNYVLYDSIVIPPNFITARPTRLTEFPTKEYFEIPEVCPFAPIPLTEEWLVKFGFDKIEWADNEYYRNGYTVKIEEGYTSVWFQTSEIEIKYVHQLQNLIFALTGQELELKQEEKK